jgi:Na+/melibiose symporter-like transporter
VRVIDRRLLTALALPSLALAFALTIVSSYVPVLLERLTPSRALIGLLLAGEGAAALVLPLIVGTWSDRTRTPLGPRLPFVIAAAAVAAAALVVLAVGSSLPILGAGLFAFYGAYFTYFSPYLALCPDLVVGSAQARVQSRLAIARMVGMGSALVAGGALLALSRPAPFVLAAVLLCAMTWVLVAVTRQAPGEAPRPTRGGALGAPWQVVRRNADVRRLLVATTLWELALAAIKSFAVLFVVLGLGRSLSFAAAVMALVAGGALVAAVAAAPLAERFGEARVLLCAAALFGAGLLLPTFSQALSFVLPSIPVFAFGAGLVMTVGYAAVLRTLPADRRGAAAGLLGFGRGVGLVLGPALAGAAVQVLAPYFPATRGYAAVWLVAGVAVLLSLGPVARIGREATRARAFA